MSLNHQRHLIYIACGLVTACAAMPVNDQSTEQVIARQTLTPMFEILDCTDEGHLESGEVAEHMSQIFLPYDSDRSHTLSKSEFSRASNLPAGALANTSFQWSDQNADGEISSQEFTVHLARLIDALDANGDGEVTPAEITAP